MATRAFAQDLNDDLLAAPRKGDAAQVKALLDRGADVNSKSSYGSTALFFACDRGHMDVIKLLLDRGADVNAEDMFYHFTPVMWAVNKNRPEVVKLLLDRGAKSPAAVLTGAVQTGNAAIVKLALEAGREKNAIDKPALASALAIGRSADGHTGDLQRNSLHPRRAHRFRHTGKGRAVNFARPSIFKITCSYR